MQKIIGSNLQCVHNHYAKINYKLVKTVRDTDNTNQTPSKHFGWEKKSKLNTPEIEKKNEMCKKGRCTSIMSQQSFIKD